VKCHDFGKPGAKAVNLSRDRGMIFNSSYFDLWSKKKIKVVGAGPPEIQQAYSWGSHASPLVKLVRDGHNDVKLSSEEWDRICTWLDINAPYYPTYDTNFDKNLFGRSPLQRDKIRRLEELTGVNWEKQSSAASVSFDRPEKSPCLEKFTDHNDPAYKEALAIICDGKKILAENPSAEMPNFKPCEDHQKRLEKYANRVAAEERNREAIRSGKKIYDREFN
jgi:hypothetical protein